MSRFKVEIFDGNDKELLTYYLHAENAIIANHNIYTNAEGIIPFRLTKYDNLKIVINKVIVSNAKR